MKQKEITKIYDKLKKKYFSVVRVKPSKILLRFDKFVCSRSSLSSVNLIIQIKTCLFFININIFRHFNWEFTLVTLKELTLLSKNSAGQGLTLYPLSYPI